MEGGTVFRYGGTGSNRAGVLSDDAEAVSYTHLLLLSGIKKENDAGCSFSNFIQKSLQNKKSQKVLPWWQNIPLTDYKPKQHILFRINTNNDYKVSIILYVGEIKKMLQDIVLY